MRHGFQKYSDMRQGYFLKSTGDIALNKCQRHATLAFLKIDRRHGDTLSRAIGRGVRAGDVLVGIMVIFGFSVSAVDS